MDEAVNLRFVLGDTLPTYYDVAISIFSVAVNPASSKMKNAIYSYATSLNEMWEKSFTSQHVIKRCNTIKRIENLVQLYSKEVYIPATRRSKKHSYDTQTTQKSIRTRNKEWKNKTIKVPGKNQFDKKCVAVSSLFDLIKESDKLTGAERVFYHDQCKERLCRLSEEIDEEWVEQQLAMFELEKKNADDNDDHQSVNSNEETDNSDAECQDLDSSINRSGLQRVFKEDKLVQTSFVYEHKPQVRVVRDCTSQIKNTCVQTSVKCGISSAKAAVAVQTVCKELYGHTYFLSKEEAIENDPNLAYLKVEVPPKKRRRLDEPKSTPRKPLTTKTDYIPYKDVLPSARTLNDHKQLLAVQAEADAASALLAMDSSVRCTLHYDTTSRSKIDGEWPSIILSFSDKKRFVLRPIFFAYETREQIIRLLVETLERLAVLANSTACALWNKIDIIMTDSVEKNLHIENGIAAALESSHVPLHLLCKAHTVEALDRSNINVLANLEQSLKFREAVESINPGVRSFLRGEKSVVLCAIKSILNFVSHDKSASSTNQADLFDMILQRENKVKHLSLYQERRFTKLGYSCASILDAMPYIQMVLNETNLSNLHTEIVQLFLDSEFLTTELLCLAYFTHKVTLPLLYATEICNQDQLCSIFPKLYNDLLRGSTDTLSDYIVKYKHLSIQEPSTDIEREILRSMCHDAAATIDRQCGREYGFGQFIQEKPRATQVSQISLVFVKIK